MYWFCPTSKCWNETEFLTSSGLLSAGRTSNAVLHRAAVTAVLCSGKGLTFVLIFALFSPQNTSSFLATCLCLFLVVFSFMPIQRSNCSGGLWLLSLRFWLQIVRIEGVESVATDQIWWLFSILHCNFFADTGIESTRDIHALQLCLPFLLLPLLLFLCFLTSFHGEFPFTGNMLKRVLLPSEQGGVLYIIAQSWPKWRSFSMLNEMQVRVSGD